MIGLSDDMCPLLSLCQRPRSSPQTVAQKHAQKGPFWEVSPFIPFRVVSWAFIHRCRIGSNGLSLGKVLSLLFTLFGTAQKKLKKGQLEGAKLIGAGIATIALGGAAIGIGNVFSEFFD